MRARRRAARERRGRDAPSADPKGTKPYAVAVRTDPTDNGGLFVGRRPGTAPTKYRALPQRGTAARQRADRLIAGRLPVLEFLISLLFWGPIPAASLWLASRVQYWGYNVGLAILVGFVAMLGTLML